MLFLGTKRTLAMTILRACILGPKLKNNTYKRIFFTFKKVLLLLLILFWNINYQTFQNIIFWSEANASNYYYHISTNIGIVCTVLNSTINSIFASISINPSYTLTYFIFVYYLLIDVRFFLTKLLSFTHTTLLQFLY